MTPNDFQDRLQRSLTGDLSEEEARLLHRELLSDPKALEEYLAARTMDQDLKRLLSPGSSEEAFLRGLLNARSAARQDPEAFVQSVTRAYSKKSPRKSAQRRRLRDLFLAAGVLVGAISLWLLASRGSEEKRHAARPRPSPEQVRVQEPPRTAAPAPVRVEAPDRPAEIVRPPEKRVDPVPPPDPEPPKPEVPKPAPEPLPPAPKPAPGPTVTVTAFATIQKAKGEVFVFTGTPARKSPAIEGQPLTPGQGVLTEGTQSIALLARQDSTRLTLGADTRIAFAEATREIALFQGKLDVDADPREQGQEVLFTTPHAEVRVQSGRLTLTSSPSSTGLQVHQGAAMFTNVWDGTSMQVKQGQRALAQDLAGVDRKRIDDAIQKGVAYLRKAPSSGTECFAIANCDELILLTLLAAGLGDTDADVQKYLKNVLAAPLGKTYLVSLQAMALEELDRVKYQDRIAECGQFLVDNQCANGQWTYSGAPSPVTSVPRSEVATAGGAKAGPDLFGRRAKATIVRRLQLKKTRDGGPQGDNSNAQYAALGLRACSEAGIAIPTETLQRAADWWRKVQYPDPAGRAVVSGEALPPKGWCYNDGKNPVNGGPCCVGAYSSMTSGAVSSLMIYDHLLGADWKKDVAVRTGVSWMTTYFAVSRNVGMDVAFKAVNGGTTPPESYHYYSLYALERVGIFSAQEKFGRHAWFAEGARVILSRQKADGSWKENSESSLPTWDTCFAILFLRRATRPLEDVPSVDRAGPNDK